MGINSEQVLYVAHLARLELDEESVKRFAEQIDTILDYVETLNEIDTAGIPPTSHATFRNNAFREDAEIPHLERTAALSNAPQHEEGNFLVPKVVG